MPKARRSTSPLARGSSKQRHTTSLGPTVEEDEIVVRSNSPRSKVARRMERLDINDPDSSDGNPSPRKRLRIQAVDVRGPCRDESTSPSRISRDRNIELDSPEKSSSTALLEIPETPSAAEPRPLRPVQPSSKDAVHQSKNSKRLYSPPPTRPEPVSLTTSVSDPGSQESVDASALTWQPSEITGFDIDVSIPDDDGEGINGVGFKPTPQMAYARRQKRRQQVCEWKARETREARQRRFERRRGCGGGLDSSSRRKLVRFTDAG